MNIDPILTLIGSVIPFSLINFRLITKILIPSRSKAGKTTVICSPMIGTFTKPDLAVKSLIFDDKFYHIDGQGNFEVERMKTKEHVSFEREYFNNSESLNLIATTMHFCRYPAVSYLEKPLFSFFEEQEISVKEAASQFSQVARIPDEDDKKNSTTVIINDHSKEIFSVSKGNPKVILEKCTRIFANGKKEEFTGVKKRQIRKLIAKLNEKGQKAIAFAYKGLPLKRQPHYSASFTENEMTFLGILTLREPIDESTITHLEEARRAGIKTYALSSIKERNTVAIGKELTLINPKYFSSINHDDLKRLTDKKLKKMLSNKEKDFIFSELDEDDRTRIKQLLKENGEIIAEPKSDQENNLQKLVEKIHLGRKTQLNERNIFRHALICKITEISLFITALALGIPQPLSIFSLLIIDLIINTLLELSLQEDKTDQDLMHKGYKVPKLLTFNRDLVFSIIVPIILTNLVLIYTLLRQGWRYGETLQASDITIMKSATICFIFISLMQIWKAFSHRDETLPFYRKIRKNPYMILTAIISALIIYGSTTVILFSDAMNFSSLSQLDLYVIIFGISLIIVVDEGRKFVNRNYGNS